LLQNHNFKVIHAQKPGALHPDATSTVKHWRVLAFSAYGRKFKPPVLRAVVDSAVPENITTLETMLEGRDCDSPEYAQTIFDIVQNFNDRTNLKHSRFGHF